MGSGDINIGLFNFREHQDTVFRQLEFRNCKVLDELRHIHRFLGRRIRVIEHIEVVVQYTRGEGGSIAEADDIRLWDISHTPYIG